MTLNVHYTRGQVQSFLKAQFPETDWSPVIAALPLIVWRHRWDTLAEKYGLPYKRSYLQNMDSKGVGPASFK